MKFCVEIRPVSGQKSQLPVFKFRPEVENFIFMFLDITVLREKLKKEQMERERYENEANHQSRKVKISRVTAPILVSNFTYGS